ncbi:MAG: flagellin [Methanofollis sp.]|nr:flagellin [Methanofollis sp.]
MNDEAFTGLEAAIVLIAFVVVAAVFSYVMLGAGFFTSQKSQEVVHTSVEQASASIEVRGDVYGYDNKTSATGEIDGLQFNLALTAGGSPVDINKTVMTYATADTVQVLTRDLDAKDDDSKLAKGEWTVIKKVGNNDADNLVERGEQFVVNVKLPQTLKANEHFNLEVKPAAGAALGLKRTAPPQIDAANLLY